MGHTMRLDKIMIWISIHLHSLPPSPSPPPPSSSAGVPTRDPGGLFFRHSAFRRVTLVIIRMLCSAATPLVSFAVEMRHERTGATQDPDRRDATKDRGERGERPRISRDRPANESSVCARLCVCRLFFP